MALSTGSTRYNTTQNKSFIKNNKNNTSINLSKAKDLKTKKRIKIT